MFVVPGVNVQERVAGPDPATLVGAKLHAALLTDKSTTPLKPLTAVTMIVDEVAPPLEVTEVGLALTVKSWKLKVAVAV